MTTDDEPQCAPTQPKPGAGLGNAAMVLGMVATVGSIYFLVLAVGMANESAGRWVEGTSDDTGHLLGIVGCVGAMLAITDVAGLVLGLLALTKPHPSKGPAIAGIVLCGLWLLVGVVVLLARA